MEDFLVKKKYIAYLRVSTKRQGESGLGLESQRSYIQYCIQKDGELVEEFVENKSGKNVSERPLLRQAIALCQTNGYYLIVAKLDRLSRDVEDAAKIFKVLKGRLCSCDIPQLDSLTLAIFAGMAQRERELISIRTVDSLKALKARGVKLGKKENLKNEHRAKGSTATAEKANAFNTDRILVSVVTMCLGEGMSREQIAVELDKNGITTFSGKPFNKHSVYRIIQKLNL